MAYPLTACAIARIAPIRGGMPAPMRDHPQTLCGPGSHRRSPSPPRPHLQNSGHIPSPDSLVQRADLEAAMRLHRGRGSAGAGQRGRTGGEDADLRFELEGGTRLCGRPSPRHAQPRLWWLPTYLLSNKIPRLPALVCSDHHSSFTVAAAEVREGVRVQFLFALCPIEKWRG